MFASFREITLYREFLREYVMQVLRSRYRGSLLGFLWTLANPLLVTLTFGIVFSAINRVEITEYLPYFLAGYLPWTLFTNTGSMANTAITGNAHYVSRVYVPKGIFPLSTFIVNFVDLIAGLAVLLAFVAIAKPAMLTPAVLFLPVAIALVSVFCIGIAYLFAALNVFFRDFMFLWNSLAFVWFFFTPILYRVEQMPREAQSLLALNVMYPFVRLFQAPVFYGTLPAPDVVLAATGYAAVSLALGVTVFHRSESRFYMYV